MRKPTRPQVKQTAIATAIIGGTLVSTAGALFVTNRYFTMKIGVTKYAYLVSLMHEKNPEFVESMMALANANLEASLNALNLQ